MRLDPFLSFGRHDIRTLFFFQVRRDDLEIFFLVRHAHAVTQHDPAHALLDFIEGHFTVNVQYASRFGNVPYPEKFWSTTGHTNSGFQAHKRFPHTAPGEKHSDSLCRQDRIDHEVGRLDVQGE